MAGGNRGSRAPRVPRVIGEGVEVVNVDIQAGHHEEIRETEDYYKTRKTVQDHNRRIMEMVKWVGEEYPEYYNQGIVPLTEEEMNDKRKYHNSTHDFNYRWSSSTQRSYIQKHGNESDVQNLPAVTRFNAPHQRKNTVKRKRTSDDDASTASST